MIDRTHALSLTRQAEALGISRGARVLRAARRCRAGRSRADAAIDALHLDFPFAGARMLRRLLRRDFPSVGRRRIGTLDAAHGDRRGVSAARHESPAPRASGVSLSPAPSLDHAAERGVGDGHHVHPDGARLRVPRGGDGLGESARAQLARLDHARRSLLHRRRRGGDRALRLPDDHEHRSGRAIHERGLHRRCCSSTASRSAWTARAAGATTSSSSGSGARSSTKKSTCTATNRCPRRRPASRATSRCTTHARPHSSLTDCTPDHVYFASTSVIAAA